MEATTTERASSRGRGLFCNRTLNLRAIRAIGYDMDYTLVHYHFDAWERRAYERTRDRFAALGWPVSKLEFDPEMVVRGLIIDTELGNLVKANRFGFVRRAAHGTRPLGFAEQRTAYASTLVDLAKPRWVFLNTLFSLSEACLYGQLVDLLDARALPGVMGYHELYRRVRETIDVTHMQGELKSDIIADPERYVVLDPEAPLTLLDQRHAGKQLMLITNSEWDYTVAMMSYSFDRFLPPGHTWRDLFDLVVVGARKPQFFTADSPFFEVVSEDGLLRPARATVGSGKAFLGGSAVQLERDLGVSGDEILYVGDHMFGDVHVTKDALRWRTALILRELEAEVTAIESFKDEETTLGARMDEKERLEAMLSRARLSAQRARHGYGPAASTTGATASGGTGTEGGEAHHQARVSQLRDRLAKVDAEIAPLAKAASELGNRRWGLLMRAGNDKSHLARQIERYADVYTSRVSNFLEPTPFVYLRSPRGSLPHDPSAPGGPPIAVTVAGGDGGNG